MRYLILALVALTLSACATAQRYDAANDVHALLISIRDNDQAMFDAHVDRPALKRQIESRLMAETTKASSNDGLAALSAILGVLPIAFGLGLEIFHQETTINAPSTQWWIALSSAIVRSSSPRWKPGPRSSTCTRSLPPPTW